MNEELATRAWADNHATLSTGISKAIGKLMDGLTVLNARQYHAPWRQPATCSDCPTR